MRTYSKEESSKLLEPWLGSGLTLDELPVPRLIVVKIARRRGARYSAVAAACWPSRCRARPSTIIAAGSTACAPWRAPRSPPASAILLLVIAATMLSVTFATRGAMATNKPVIEVLHFVGAKNGFIAGHFQRHFLLLGLQGGAIGGGVAIVLFALAGVDQRLVRRHRRGRADRGLVRIVLHRHCRLYRRARPGRADRAGDGGDLAAYRQPDAGYDRLTCWPGFARWIGFLTMAAGAGRRRAAGRSASSGSSLKIPAEEVTLDRNADGIVVLTGAAARIPDAIELLAAEHGKRLLISGVHRDTARAKSRG